MIWRIVRICEGLDLKSVLIILDNFINFSSDNNKSYASVVFSYSEVAFLV